MHFKRRGAERFFLNIASSPHLVSYGRWNNFLQVIKKAILKYYTSRESPSSDQCRQISEDTSTNESSTKVNQSKTLCLIFFFCPFIFIISFVPFDTIGSRFVADNDPSLRFGHQEFLEDRLFAELGRLQGPRGSSAVSRPLFEHRKTPIITTCFAKITKHYQ